MLSDKQLNEARRELERELRVREIVYPKWVHSGKMTQQTLERRNGRLKNAIKFLRDAEANRVSPTLFD